MCGDLEKPPSVNRIQRQYCQKKNSTAVRSALCENTVPSQVPVDTTTSERMLKLLKMCFFSTKRQRRGSFQGKDGGIHLHSAILTHRVGAKEMTATAQFLNIIYPLLTCFVPIRPPLCLTAEPTSKQYAWEIPRCSLTNSAAWHSTELLKCSLCLADTEQRTIRNPRSAGCTSR